VGDLRRLTSGDREEHEGNLELRHMMEPLHETGRVRHGPDDAAKRWAQLQRACILRDGAVRYLKVYWPMRAWMVAAAMGQEVVGMMGNRFVCRLWAKLVYESSERRVGDRVRGSYAERRFLRRGVGGGGTGE